MRVLVQRVANAKVTVGETVTGEIGKGVLLLVGVGKQDTKAEADWLANKISGLRIFEDEAGATNLSLMDVEGSALVVSQFTLYADTRKGRRPSFINAALPDQAEPLVTYFANQLAEKGIPIAHGQFGAHMKVELLNDGPFTVWLER